MKEKLEKKIEYWNRKIDKECHINREYHFNQKGQIHGSYKSYYLSNRSLCTQTEFKNDQRNGLYKRK